MNIATIDTFVRIFVAVSGAFSVLFGAWLAHAGQSLPVEHHERLTTALMYQFTHTIVILVLWLFYRVSQQRNVLYLGLLFLFGIVLFSGSLYIKTWLNLDAIGKVAPFGGMLFAIAWLALLFIGKTKK